MVNVIYKFGFVLNKDGYLSIMVWYIPLVVEYSRTVRCKVGDQEHDILNLQVGKVQVKSNLAQAS